VAGGHGQMIREYRALLRGQYEKTKLYHYLTKFEEHKNAVSKKY